MPRKRSPDNPPCPRCGATEVNRNGSKDGKPRWVCLACGRSFGPTFGTAMYCLRTPPAEVARTLFIVMRRGSLSAAEEITGHKYGCGLPPSRPMRSLRPWCMICTLPRWKWMPSGRLSKKAPRGWGRRRRIGRGGPALDRPTRFVMAWAFAPSEAEAAPEVVRQTRHRTHQHAGVAWVGDGRAVYRREIRRTYRDPQRTGRRGRPPPVPTPGVKLTQVVKRRRDGRVVGVLGEPVPFPYPVHEERLNGVLRDRLNALTRQTHAFAKDTRTWDALFEHNWLRPHPALREPAEGLANGRRYRRRTPAMAIGLTDHVWSWEEFLTFKHYH